MVRETEFKYIVALSKPKTYLARFPAEHGSVMPLDFGEKWVFNYWKSHNMLICVFKHICKYGTKMLFKYQWDVRVHCWKYQFFPNPEDLRQPLNTAV